MIASAGNDSTSGNWMPPLATACSVIGSASSGSIPTCVGQVLCDVCSRVSNDESETVYIDKKDIVYRHVLQVKRADGKMHVTARELVAIGL